ncbi:hypothetical protein CBR_g21956 [Chara braunii]|uniref:Uncharacterized protein n=1 Tax=Chara braunii TaxID=69332 RepID=A0A388L1M7_CHABU|nr:hypothetical protein CBR_g21956 [Chara braunii]|eukprot:GBG76207.1 hypothetical protein CBR_g21956 [Chara braunii]
MAMSSDAKGANGRSTGKRGREQGGGRRGRSCACACKREWESAVGMAQWEIMIAGVETRGPCCGGVQRKDNVGSRVDRPVEGMGKGESEGAGGKEAAGGAEEEERGDVHVRIYGSRREHRAWEMREEDTAGDDNE